MRNAQSFAGQKKVAPIAFQPLLPQPAHPARGLLLWGVPAAVLQGSLAVAALWFSAGGTPVDTEPETIVHIVEMPAELAVPSPPPPPEPPRLEPSTPVPDVKGFQTLAMPTIEVAEIPPPVLGEITLRPMDFLGEGVEGGRGGAASAPEPLEAGPSFTPFTVAPWLKNSAEVARTLQREYPSSLRDAGIGARVLIWLFIDESGRVQRTTVKESSGFESLDAAASRVAMSMEFAPAVNRDRKVSVWVALPIDFAVS